MWHVFWDVAFSLSSVLLVLIFGVALGNMLRGLPIGANGYFQGTFTFLLNPYALLVGVFAVLALVQHGATFLMLRLDGPPTMRAAGALRLLPWISLVGFVVVTAATFVVRGGPVISWLDALPVLSVAALLLLARSVARGDVQLAFAMSSVWLATMLIEASATLFPYLLPSFPLGGGLSIYGAAPSPVGLVSAVSVIVVGLAIVLIYGRVLLKMLAVKIVVGES
jgi:cytochrome d ubiquinol oxidase subunit II